MLRLQYKSLHDRRLRLSISVLEGHAGVSIYNNIVNVHEVCSSFDSERTNEQTPCEHNAVQKCTAIKLFFSLYSFQMSIFKKQKK